MSGHSIDVWTWRTTLREQVQLAPGTEHAPLDDARGRMLAAPVTSPEHIPSVPLSAMDGFAVHRADLRAPGATRLPVVGDLPARPGTTPALPRGTAMRIMTGAPVPAGADAVVEVEATDAHPFGALPSEVRITLENLPPVQRHIRARGEETARGDLLAEPGCRIGAGLLGVARSLGITSLPVLAPVRVGVVVTGDELAGPDGTAAEGVMSTGDARDEGITGGDGRGGVIAGGEAPDGQPAAGMVRESNGLMLAAAAEADGARARTWRIGDEPAALRTLLREVEEQCDLVLTTGGIGQGAFDVVRAALGEHGSGTSDLVHLALRPGGPQGRGRLPGGTPVIHLPGTPVGALVGYHLFVRQLLPGVDADPIRVRLGEDPDGFQGRRGRSAMLAQPGTWRRDDAGHLLVDVLSGKRLTPYARADALVLREPAGGTDDDERSTRGRTGNQVLALPL